MRGRGGVVRAVTLSALLAGVVGGCSSTVGGHGPSARSATSATSSAAASSVLPSAVSSPAVSSSSVPVSSVSSVRTPATHAPSSPHPSAAALPTSSVSFPAGSGPLVVLNPGHNGGNGSHSAEINRPVPAGFGQTKACDTTGTTTNGGYPEHAFNWDVTLRVRDLLAAHGVRVVLTRPDDTGVGPCVDERAAIGNRPGVAAVISIHADGAPTAGHGFHVCEASRPPAGAAVAVRSHALTVAVHDALTHGSGLVTSTYLGSNGYYPRSDLAGLNLATVPATFLELGNMRNAGDASLQTSAAGRERIAAAVAAGILAYLGR